MDIKYILCIVVFFIIIRLVSNRELYSDNDYLKEIIVKIYSQNIKYNWIEPYKIDSSHESIGTGFFISKNLILTASHVIEDSIRIDVTLPSIGKKKFRAEVVSIIPWFDIGLLKVTELEGKKWLKFGNSNKVKSGDKVLAVGYPLAQDKLKLTAGIISGLHKGEIQTDAPINPGNSGGPLLNENNEVIGINVSGYTHADNIGYAVPINRYKLYEKEMNMSKDKLIFKPIMGGLYINSNSELLDYYKINDEGILIVQVYKDGPLEKSGIKPGDILCKFDKYPVDKYGEIKVDWYNEKLSLDEIFNEYKIDDEINIIFYRNGIKKKSILKLGSLSYYKIRSMYPQFENINYEIIGGIIFMDLKLKHLSKLSHTDLDKYSKFKNQIYNKIVVTKIMKGSYINNLELLEEGMTLEKINNKNVDTVNELIKEFIRLKNNKDKYIIYDFTDGTRVVLELDKIISEDKFLIGKYKYEISY
jgi:serine protease Do